MTWLTTKTYFLCYYSNLFVWSMKEASVKIFQARVELGKQNSSEVCSLLSLQIVLYGNFCPQHRNTVTMKALEIWDRNVSWCLLLWLGQHSHDMIVNPTMSLFLKVEVTIWKFELWSIYNLWVFFVKPLQFVLWTNVAFTLCGVEIRHGCSWLCPKSDGKTCTLITLKFLIV